jgi:hypothetical protein
MKRLMKVAKNNQGRQGKSKQNHEYTSGKEFSLKIHDNQS